MHAVIWHALEFPDYYGCNWSDLLFYPKRELSLEGRSFIDFGKV
jgi:hypothetical protein